MSFLFSPLNLENVQGSTNLILASTGFCARKMVLCECMVFVHAKLCVKIVDSSLYGLIYNELTDILFLYILPDEDMLNTKGLATLTEHQEVS